MRLWGLTPPQWRALPEEDREEMLEEYAAYCPKCGNLRSVCSDPTRAWYPQRSMCYPSASLELVQRKLQERHKKSEPGTTTLHPLDGMSVWVSEFDLTPDDDFV